MRRKLSSILICVGALLILGAAGDSDLGRLSFSGMLLYVVLGILLSAVGFMLHKKVNTPERKPESVPLYNEVFVDNEIVNCKQNTTPAYKNILTQRKEFVNHETY